MKTHDSSKHLSHRHARRQAHANVTLPAKALRELPDPDDLDLDALPERITARSLHDLDIDFDFGGADAPSHGFSGRFHS